MSGFNKINNKTSSSQQGIVSKTVKTSKSRNGNESNFNMKMSSTTTETKQVVCNMLQPTEVSQRKKLVFSWVQDVSGSMSGHPIKTSITGLEFMFQNVLAPEDYLSVIAFNTNIRMVHNPMRVAGIDRERDFKAIREAMRDGAGGTKTYDAIGNVITDLVKSSKDPKFSKVHDDAVYQLLVVTDGEDNASTEFNLKRCAELIAHSGLPNFHLWVIGVGMTEYHKQQYEMLCAPRHANYLDIADFSKFQATMERVGNEVRKSLQVVRQVISTTVTKTVSATAGAHNSLLLNNVKGAHMLLDTAVGKPTVGPTVAKKRDSKPSRSNLTGIKH